MTPQQLSEIEARAKAATEEPGLSYVVWGRAQREFSQHAIQDSLDLIAYIRELESMIGEKTGDIVDRLERNLDAAFDKILP